MRSNNENLDIFATHKSIKDFLPYEKKYKLKDESELSKFYFYESLFSNLLNTTRKFFPMYKENILNIDDVYDYVHTNKSGSNRIAQYIFNILQTKN